MTAKASRFILVALIMVTSCIDEYWPDIKNYENLLVVDGTLTQDPGPYTVRLSLTSAVDKPAFIPYPGCRVTISDTEGTTELLTEQEPGIYVTSPDGIQGQIGNMYKIAILTPEGRSYESPYEELRAPIGIDTVYALVETVETADLYHDLEGYQFYVDTYRAGKDSTYFLWQMEETYEFYSDFYIDYLFAGSITQFSNRDTVHTCWHTENVYEIFTANTLNLTDPVLKGYPLHYVDTETRRLTVQYSLLVNQFTISPDAFTFWDDIRSMAFSEGSLYSKQPFQVTGNIRNANDPDEPVLGYFLVAGVDIKRYFFSQPYGVRFYYTVCELNTDMRSLYMEPRHYWPIYMSQTTEGVLGYASDPCFDCTLNEGTLEKPDFWPY